ncbi:MAG: bifunctional diaminohydroxyphosphoribosylaminopyrimidine deaminase/5-amino-6-(5-phosphoribosylamino)uracil reductase RibD [Candidatus Omnitrophota bacterium]
MRTDTMNHDIYFMKKAIALARRAEGATSPNPLVGAVIAKNNKIIGHGYHHKAGLSHAEVDALKNVRGSAAGATLYVNLEPCCHFGKTGPCVDEIIRAKIKRVVIGVMDPNPRVHGRSIAKLKAAGIAVQVGVLKEQAAQANEVFFTNMRKCRPFVVAKIAQSLDGKSATREHKSHWITSTQSRNYAKCLRDRYDAVLVGVATVIADNPTLNGIKKIPYKIIFDPILRIPRDAHLVRQVPERLIIVTARENKKNINSLPGGITILFARTTHGSFDLSGVLSSLYAEGITSIFAEGGAETLGRLFDARLIDKIYCFIAPKIIAGRLARTSIAGRGVASPGEATVINDVRVEHRGEDLLISGYPCYKT